MTSILEQVTTSLPDVHAKAKFNSQDFIAVLQGLVGFSSAAATKDPFKALESALNIAGSFSGKQCLKSLDSYMGSIKQWLTFGKHYKPLVDSSDLDFDQMEVSSVPQIMQVCVSMRKNCAYRCLSEFNMCNLVVQRTTRQALFTSYITMLTVS